ncbi:tripartite motif-containing protein 16-like isoform X2 [Boleophthalmus pectinirostris]|uniref:tripartite motif-containing protein 16-like isoform X2 n=1 Tax=Boleophthalmus pectinirostris TaxID=150288 RepID=UPI0024323F67|nr:tripartite motif-containing protein 16-like isoform X2 [Boleophthalmus pectinirostris]
MATINDITQGDQNATEEGMTVKQQFTGDVMCDSCIDSPSRALKSCLTCLVSYCESHLRPHLENVKFQNHQLVEPLHDIDCPTCEVHHLPLDRVCLDHGFYICSNCETEVHEGHMTASAEEARAKIEEKQAKISQCVSEAERAIGKLQGNNDTVKTLVQDVSAMIELQFSRLQNAVEEAKRTVMEVLDREQRQALQQSDSIQAHLEQRREELTKLHSHTNKLLRAKSNVEFLQKYSEWKKMSTDVSLPFVHNKNMEHLSSYVQTVTDTTQQLCDLLLSSYKESMDEVFKSGYKTKPKAEPSPLPLPVTREDFIRYQKSLTFDPDTVHNFLRVTEDHRKLTNTSPWQHSYADTASRFDYWRQALTSDSLYLGRHYIEADLSGEGAHIGVTYKIIGRKGEQKNSCICQNEYSWCIGRNSKGFSVWHAGVETPLEVTDITTVGLFIDFHEGQLSFYKVNDHFVLLHTFEADILEPLYVVVWLSKKDNKVRLYESNKTF